MSTHSKTIISGLIENAGFSDDIDEFDIVKDWAEENCKDHIFKISVVEKVLILEGNYVPYWDLIDYLSVTLLGTKGGFTPESITIIVEYQEWFRGQVYQWREDKFDVVVPFLL